MSKSTMIQKCKVLFFQAKAVIIGLMGILTFNKLVAAGNCCGKVEIAPAFVHLDVLEHEKTVKKIDLPAVRADATLLIWKGFSLKPTFLYGSHEGKLTVAGLGIGHCTPVTDKLLVTPSIGYNYTDVRTFINLPIFGLRHLKERFKSQSPYIGLEANYTFTPGWRIGASVQYAWSRSHTYIQKIAHHSKTKCQGPSYAIQLERDLDDLWSINVGAAYNISLDKEKHGLRGYGFKIGLVRWFYNSSGSCCSWN